MKRPTETALKLADNFASFSVKWGVSRGYSTYGYTTCSMRLNRLNGVQIKAAYCSGGGYDMRGTVLGRWMTDFFREDLKKLCSSTGSGDRWSHKNTFYGLNFYDPKRRKFRKTWRPGYDLWLDGGCGFSCMERILNQFGVTLQYQRINANEDLYTFNLTNKKGR